MFGYDGEIYNDNDDDSCHSGGDGGGSGIINNGQKRERCQRCYMSKGNAFFVIPAFLLFLHYFQLRDGWESERVERTEIKSSRDGEGRSSANDGRAQPSLRSHGG